MAAPEIEYTTLMARVNFFDSDGRIVPGWPHIGTLQYEPIFNQSLWPRTRVILAKIGALSSLPAEWFIVPCINCADSKVALCFSGQSGPGNKDF